MAYRGGDGSGRRDRCRRCRCVGSGLGKGLGTEIRAKQKKQKRFECHKWVDLLSRRMFYHGWNHDFNEPSIV
jgi:hypothetical protein